MSNNTAQWITAEELSTRTGWWIDTVTARAAHRGVTPREDGMFNAADVQAHILSRRGRGKQIRRPMIKTPYRDGGGYGPFTTPAPELIASDETSFTIKLGSSRWAGYRSHQPNVPAWKVIVDDGSNPEQAHAAFWADSPADALAQIGAL